MSITLINNQEDACKKDLEETLERIRTNCQEFFFGNLTVVFRDLTESDCWLPGDGPTFYLCEEKRRKGLLFFKKVALFFRHCNIHQLGNWLDMDKIRHFQ